MNAPRLRSPMRAAAAMAGVLLAAAAFAGEASRVFDAAARTTVIDNIAKTLDEHYKNPALVPQIVKLLRDSQARGAYDTLNEPADFAARLSSDMQSISHDLHMRVDLRKEKPAVAAGKPDRDALLAKERRANYGLKKVEILDGNIGYLKIDAFADPETGGATMAAAMEAVRYTDALVIDLRDNKGGGSMTQVLASYFFSGPPFLIQSVHYPRQNDSMQIWTLPYVPGARYLDRPVYVLISPRTFSAGEAFAMSLSNFKRATLVGQPTAGAANPNMFFPVHALLTLSVPLGETVLPNDRENWEGKGVTPDVKVDEKQALNEAYKLGLKELIGKAQPGAQKDQLAKLLNALP